MLGRGPDWFYNDFMNSLQQLKWLQTDLSYSSVFYRLNASVCVCVCHCDEVQPEYS